MIMQRTVPVLAAALLLAAGTVWADPPDDSNAGERVETPRAEPQEAPSEPPPQAQAPDPPPSPEPSAPASDSGSADDDSSTGHTAVPTGPDDRGHGPNRQPPTHHGGGHDGGGGADGDGDGGFYDNSGYEEDDPRSAGSAYGLPPALGGGRGPRDDMGALDLDISPARTKVYLDGQPIGTVDDFDGWPKYLWLPEGTYDLVFYLDGYQTIGRRMTVRPALVIDMDDHLQPGRSIRPEDVEPEPGD